MYIYRIFDFFVFMLKKLSDKISIYELSLVSFKTKISELGA